MYIDIIIALYFHYIFFLDEYKTPGETKSKHIKFVVSCLDSTKTINQVGGIPPYNLDTVFEKRMWLELFQK